ncbi:MAG: system Fe-S cluster assembly regulator [Gammaproteobacteria bacterium]|jgi:FeS assembly SUF system regulator|nr:system Fe-S cluster assembly regulator [Gammaproteobacteria bacterium]
MLRISKLADYATMIMAYCAHAPEQSYTAKKIAEATKIQLPTVSKLLKLLAKGHLLLSQRGVQGGYQIAKPPREISMADIIAAVDGPIALTECNHGISDCGLIQNCATKHSWQLINIAIQDALSKVSLAQMTGAQIETKINLNLLKHPHTKEDTIYVKR